MHCLIANIYDKFYYYRSLDYTVNGYYKNHVTVFAEVVPVSLELSTDHLIVEPQVGLPADAGQNTLCIFSWMCVYVCVCVCVVVLLQEVLCALVG